jgi:hypothetical protein
LSLRGLTGASFHYGVATVSLALFVQALGEFPLAILDLFLNCRFFFLHKVFGAVLFGENIRDKVGALFSATTYDAQVQNCSD